jgi:DNA-binding MarR family transcriptional regulator
MTPLEPGASPGFLLWHTTLRWQRTMAAVLAPMDLTHVQFVLLASTWWLNRSGEHPNQIQVARQAGTEPKMTSEVLRTLERKALVLRAPDPQDTRAKRLRVTDRGSELAIRSIAAVEAADAEFFAPVARDDAIQMLFRLARAPEEDDARKPRGQRRSRNVRRGESAR